MPLIYDLKSYWRSCFIINKFAVNLRLPWFLLLRQNVDLRRMNTTGVQLLRIL